MGANDAADLAHQRCVQMQVVLQVGQQRLQLPVVDGVAQQRGVARVDAAHLVDLLEQRHIHAGQTACLTGQRHLALAMCRLDNNTVLEKGLYFYQGNDFASELVYSIGRLCEPCLEHIDNNFKPLDTIQKGEFSDVTEDIVYLLQICRHKMENNDYEDFENELRKANDLNGQLSHLKREELQRIQTQSGSIKVSMVYLTMIQEAQNVVTYTINLMKVSRKFQLTDGE